MSSCAFLCHYSSPLTQFQVVSPNMDQHWKTTCLSQGWQRCPFFICDQAAIWLLQSCQSICPSICLSVRMSVRHTFLTMFPSSYHHEIFRSYYHGQKRCPCKRSRSKVEVTEVNTQLSRFRTLTPVWIHIWQWNHVHSWKQHRRGPIVFQCHPSNFKVTRL